jgi:PAS domain S-box-containing protein
MFGEFLDGTDHPPRILIVDDELADRSILEALLASERFDVATAESGKQALEMIEAHAPDLVLLDVMMPEMDGFAVVTAIKSDQQTKSIPVIMVTARDDRDARLVSLGAGADEFLSKPVDGAELRIRVKNLLRLRAFADYSAKYAQKLEREVVSQTDALRRERDRATAAEERTRFALEAANVGTWDMDHSTGLVRWSEKSEAHFGLAPGTFGGTYASFIDLIHPDDRASILAKLAVADATAGDFFFQHRVIWPDGSLRWLAGAGRVHHNPDGTPRRAMGVTLDITERQALEQQFQQAQKMEAIGRLASGVAHDFNNLLTVILGFADLMTTEIPSASQHGKDLGEILKAAQRATSLTKQLLAFSRQQVLNVAELDVNELVTDMSGMLGRLIGKDIKVSLNLSPVGCNAIGDRSQLEQVVMNLVVNARDAMPQGGRLTIETAQIDLQNSAFQTETIIDGHYVMISVSDTGTGMTKETQRRLFEPFFTTKEIGKGTGLGLSTTYGIVKQSQGYIWVYSELGIGTTFKVYIPSSDGLVQPAADNAPVSLPTSGAFETILLVEDEAGVRQLSKRILENAGYQVIEAADGIEAERLFLENKHTIHLVVTDVVMPGLSGPETFARLQAIDPELRVLYMSGYTEQSAAVKAGLGNGVPFIQKPFTAGEFASRLRSAFDLRPA